ncbi:SOS response-associated peptidase family protein [Brevibacillus invocatus]|uniref:SOS response-associated peptidase family protein n=1 Tax=Brevibacillus invocatus TaxID=173959 RepID=UPI001FE53A85|nr:SOS response-associated peptidase family protein [Brevibacillus invocatus]
MLHSCTIITTKPNDVDADIHDRMPVILNKDDEAIWLDREKFGFRSIAVTTCSV